MSDLFDEDEKMLIEDELIGDEPVLSDRYEASSSDARRRLEELMEEKRLRYELEDFLDD